MPDPFTSRTPQELAAWFRRQAIEAGAKMKSIARCKSDRLYYRGQQVVYEMLTAMIERGELVISMSPKEEDKQE